MLFQCKNIGSIPIIDIKINAFLAQKTRVIVF
jgi:hypothetical protein